MALMAVSHASISDLSSSHFLDKFRVTLMLLMTLPIHPERKLNLIFSWTSSNIYKKGNKPMILYDSVAEKSFAF